MTIKNLSMIGITLLIGIFIVGFYACVTKEPVKDRDFYEVVIIGSGPGGLTAGIYTSRAKRDTLIFEGDAPGGLLTGNPTVQNWPGYKEISGYDLMEKIHDHAEYTGCSFTSDYVTAVDFSSYPYKIFTRKNRIYKTNAVIIAMGVKRRLLGCPGEQEYWGKGVSACATCDAPLFREKRIVVVGGGATALTEAHHLSRFAKEVVIIYRGSRFKTIDPIKEVVLQDKNINITYNHVVKEIQGDGNRVTKIVVQNVEDKKLTTIPVDGVFVAIGFEPNTTMLQGQIELDEHGYIKVDTMMQTSKKGVFAVGDIIHMKFQQAIVAAGDGCCAALSAIYYLDRLKVKKGSFPF